MSIWHIWLQFSVYCLQGKHLSCVQRWKWIHREIHIWRKTNLQCRSLQWEVLCSWLLEILLWWSHWRTPELVSGPSGLMRKMRIWDCLFHWVSFVRGADLWLDTVDAEFWNCVHHGRGCLGATFFEVSILCSVNQWLNKLQISKWNLLELISAIFT